IATITAIVAACLSLASVFLPTGELVIREPMATHRAERSLYELGRSSGAVRNFVAAFRSSAAKRVGMKVLDRVAPHLPGRLGSDAADLRDAVTILDGLKDRDIDTAGEVMTATLWTLIALHVLLVLLLQGTDVETSRARVILSLVVAVVTAAVAIGVHVALTEIVDAANAELERHLFTLRSGAYLLPLGATIALATVLATAVTHALARRDRRRLGLPIGVRPPAFA
ncbi:MAG TPA: hypothetical protein VHE35_14925, partial [Kofleriaceae bacterium]|nr:hypothetical protein [Kofleriaceae bacterium]